MEYRGLKIAKDILFRTFWIGFGLMLVFWFLYLLGRPVQAAVMAQWGLYNPETIELVSISLFAWIKFVLIFCVLVPALAIQWTLRKLEKASA